MSAMRGLAILLRKRKSLTKVFLEIRTSYKSLPRVNFYWHS
jgi:hypothetical protein